MSELLNSGLVGIGDKTVEQTVKNWSQLGFLEGLEPKDKITVALLYEKAASNLLNLRNVYAYDSRIDVVIFPIIRRVFSSIKRFESNPERAEGMTQLLTSEYILKRASELYPDALSFYDKHFSRSLMDIEAYCTAWLCEIMAQEYINSFDKKDIISLGDNKFEVVVKIKD